jgi:hypothetical protein
MEMVADEISGYLNKTSLALSLSIPTILVLISSTIPLISLSKSYHSITLILVGMIYAH